MGYTVSLIKRVVDNPGAGLDRVGFMEEIALRMEHDLPFNNVAKAFPGVRFYRWCNSMVDYLEFLADDRAVLDRLEESLPRSVASLHSSIVYRSRSGTRLEVMVRCRCSPQNSTVRMTEGQNCLWKPPVVYEAGREHLTVLAPEPARFRSLYRELREVAKVEILRKVSASPDVLRDSYTLSLSELFQDLTAKQIEVLLRAVERGYFDIPKTVSLERLAREASLGESTLQEHLSKAEARLVRALAPYLRLYGSSVPR
jgi:predicted DNA binding protein